MGIFDWLRRTRTEDAAPRIYAMAGEMAEFYGMDDPRFKEFIRSGGAGMTEAGISVSPKVAMRNTTVLRCVSLISFAIGWLPLQLHERETKEKATGHPLYRILHRRPNAWQTAFEFRAQMQQNALVHGNAYALIQRSGTRVRQLVPLDPPQVAVRQRHDWTLEYDYRRPDGRSVIYPQADIFHLRYGMTDDGILGLSLVKQAAEAIALAIQAEKAAARVFRNGMLAGGALSHKDKLSPEAYERLKASMAEREGAENAHRWLILEEGMDMKSAPVNGRDSQHVEQRRHQIEDIARPFGVPRPLLNVDDTSWGSGIDVLGQFFVRYALNPWFEAWQQAIERDLLSDAEAESYEAKFNAGALLRGSMKDQAEFFSRALGAGGHQPWMDYEEVREIMDLPEKNIAPNPITNRSNGNEPQEAS